MSTDLCRGCHAQIIWVHTDAGKSMPLDAAPTTSSNPRDILYTTTGTRLLVTTFGQVRTGHVPHWAACPDRAKFKRRPPAPTP